MCKEVMDGWKHKEERQTNQQLAATNWGRYERCVYNQMEAKGTQRRKKWRKIVEQEMGLQGMQTFTTTNNLILYLIFVKICDCQHCVFTFYLFFYM